MTQLLIVSQWAAFQGCRETATSTIENKVLEGFCVKALPIREDAKDALIYYCFWSIKGKQKNPRTLSILFANSEILVDELFEIQFKRCFFDIVF